MSHKRAAGYVRPFRSADRTVATGEPSARGLVLGATRPLEGP
jgi:hypothetical protein